jgi:hypothetical protein
MDGNTVIGMEMSVMPGSGDWAGEGVMPQEQQSAFFAAASELVAQDDTLGGSKGVVFLLVTDNQAQVTPQLSKSPPQQTPQGNNAPARGGCVRVRRKSTFCHAGALAHAFALRARARVKRSRECERE